jgi:hypothetical protein
MYGSEILVKMLESDYFSRWKVNFRTKERAGFAKSRYPAL